MFSFKIDDAPPAGPCSLLPPSLLEQNTKSIDGKFDPCHVTYTNLTQLSFDRDGIFNFGLGCRSLRHLRMRDGHGLNISNRNHFVNIDKVFFIPTFLHRDFETKFRKLPLPELHFRNFRCRSLFLFCGTTGTHTQSLCQATVGIIREKSYFRT